MEQLFKDLDNLAKMDIKKKVRDPNRVANLRENIRVSRLKLEMEFKSEFKEPPTYKPETNKYNRLTTQERKQLFSRNQVRDFILRRKLYNINISKLKQERVKDIRDTLQYNIQKTLLNQQYKLHKHKLYPTKVPYKLFWVDSNRNFYRPVKKYENFGAKTGKSHLLAGWKHREDKIMRKYFKPLDNVRKRKLRPKLYKIVEMECGYRHKTKGKHLLYHKFISDPYYPAYKKYKHVTE